MFIPVQRLHALRFSGAVETDLLDTLFGGVQQRLAMFFQGFAALVDGDRLVQRHVSALQACDNAFQLGDGLFEGITADIGCVGIFRHFQPFIILKICMAADSASPSRS